MGGKRVKYTQKRSRPQRLLRPASAAVLRPGRAPQPTANPGPPAAILARPQHRPWRLAAAILGRGACASAEPGPPAFS